MIDWSVLFKGGIYILNCCKLNKGIIGQTNCFAIRFASYDYHLKKKDKKELNPILIKIKDFYASSQFNGFSLQVLEVVDALDENNLQKIEWSYLKNFIQSENQITQLYNKQQVQTIFETFGINYNLQTFHLSPERGGRLKKKFLI